MRHEEGGEAGMEKGFPVPNNGCSDNQMERRGRKDGGLMATTLMGRSYILYEKVFLSMWLDKKELWRTQTHEQNLTENVLWELSTQVSTCCSIFLKKREKERMFKVNYIMSQIPPPCHGPWCVILILWGSWLQYKPIHGNIWHSEQLIVERRRKSTKGRKEWRWIDQTNPNFHPGGHCSCRC